MNKRIKETDSITEFDTKKNRIKISEAQELYKSAIETNDEKLKKLLMDKLILNTLYVVYNYLNRNKINMFSTAVYGFDDILNSFIEVWIRKMQDGSILKVNRLSLLINSSFINEVYISLGGNEIAVPEHYYLSIDHFISLFVMYLEYKNMGKEFTQNDLIKYFYDNAISRRLFEGYLFDFNIIKIFDTIYKNLELEKLDDLQIKKTKIQFFFKLILNSGLTEYIEDNYPDYSMEETILQSEVFKNIIKDVSTVINNKKATDVINERFGLIDGKKRTLKQVGKDLNISTERVRQVELRALRKLRINKDFVKKYRGL